MKKVYGNDCIGLFLWNSGDCNFEIGLVESLKKRTFVSKNKAISLVNKFKKKKTYVLGERNTFLQDSGFLDFFLYGCSK